MCSLFPALFPPAIACRKGRIKNRFHCDTAPTFSEKAPRRTCGNLLFMFLIKKNLGKLDKFEKLLLFMGNPPVDYSHDIAFLFRLLVLTIKSADDENL
jgi:hypothetical protein